MQKGTTCENVFTYFNVNQQTLWCIQTFLEQSYVFMVVLNPFLANVPILYPLETPEISGKLVLKSKLSPCSGSVALRKTNPIHKKGSYSFF